MGIFSGHRPLQKFTIAIARSTHGQVFLASGEIHESQLLRIHFRSILPSTEPLDRTLAQLMPGTVFIDHGQLCIKTGDGAIIVEALQPECKVVMPVYDFLNGHKNFEGAVLK